MKCCPKCGGWVVGLPKWDPTEDILKWTHSCGYSWTEEPVKKGKDVKP